jgi:hypothetical protein
MSSSIGMRSAIDLLVKSVVDLESAVGIKPPVGTPPLTYSAISDRVIRPLPPLPALGPAGSVFADPTFGSRILRVTDDNTAGLAYKGRMATVASSAEQNMFNADSTMFYTNQAYTMFWELDKATFTVKPVIGTKGTPLQITMREPEWSFTDPDVIYFATGSKLQMYNFKSFTSTVLVDLAAVVPGYVGGVGAVSASRDDKISVSCNGSAQDDYDTAVIHDRKTGTNRIINTRTCTIDGVPLKIATPFSVGIHNVRMDKSGRYARISPGTKFQPLANVTFTLVDLITGTAEHLGLANRGGGHSATGYAAGVNGEVPPGDYGPQAMVRSFADLSKYTTLLPGSTGAYIGGVSYLSWNNAVQGAVTPTLGTDYQYHATNPYAGEVFAIATDGSKKAWRFCHHRGRFDKALGFWHYGRATISQCGRYALFMSNWEQTLGLDPSTQKVRTDVFLVELK